MWELWFFHIISKSKTSQRWTVIRRPQCVALPRVVCLSRWCRIPPDLTQECVLGDDEGRIWYWPLEIVDIPGPGGTKRHFCFLWSPSSGINAASCNLSLEPSKTLRHLMTLQGRLSSSWRAGGRGRRGGRGRGVQILSHCTVYIQWSSAHGGGGEWRGATVMTVNSAVIIQVQSILSDEVCRRRPEPPQRGRCASNWEVGILTPAQQAQHSRTTSVSFADRPQQTTRNSGTNGSVMRDEK